MSERLSPIKAIRANCLDCCCGSSNEVKLCPIESCPLYPYRLGKNPYRELTEEQKTEKAKILQKARNLKSSKSIVKTQEKNHESFGREFIPPERQTLKNTSNDRRKTQNMGKSEGAPDGKGV